MSAAWQTNWLFYPNELILIQRGKPTHYVSYNPQNPNGQATSTNSSPVVIASDQSAVPISGTITANAGTAHL